MSKKLSQFAATPTLTNYVQGAGEQAVSKVADFISPVCPVPRSVGKFKIWNDKSRLVIPDTRRAVGGKATVIKFEAGDGNYNCEPHALDHSVDFMEQDDNDTCENLVKEGANIAGQLGALAHEKVVLDKAQADATAGTTLDSTSAIADLVDIIDQQIINVVKGAKGMGAMMVIRLMFGISAFRKFKNHASVKDRFKMGSKKDIVNPTIEDVLGLFVAKVEAQVSLLVVDTNQTIDAASVDFMFGSKLLVFATMEAPTRYDTSFMKTFRKMGGFMVPRFYESEDGRQQMAGFDWSEEVQTTNAGASRLCNVT